MSTLHSLRAYKLRGHDAVRTRFEREHFAQLLPELLASSGGGRVLDLGCFDGLVAELLDGRSEEYLGVDLRPPSEPPTAPATFLAHDLREGLGPVGRRPFDLYLATFGLASHLHPVELGELLEDIAAHGRPGSVVALEALGLFSLEWPDLWGEAPGEGRALPYRLAEDVVVYPWAPDELAAAFEAAGLRFERTIDRTLQAGPKLGEGRYWPGLPDVRGGLNLLLDGYADGAEPLLAPLPPLPAHPAAQVHRELGERRRALVERAPSAPATDPQSVARAVWALEPTTGDGLGHGMMAVGRVP